MKRFVALSNITIALLLAGCSSEPSGPETVSVEALIEVSSATGTVLTDFVFDAGGSSATTRALEYRWDWESDGRWDTAWSGDPMATHRFADLESPTVTLEVRSGGFTDQATRILSVDLNHGNVVRTLEVDEFSSLQDLAFDGQNFWILSFSNSIVRVNSENGDTLSSFDPPSSWPNALTWDGVQLWVTDNVSPGEHSYAFKLDMSTGLVAGSFPLEFTNRDSGLSYRDGLFYHGSSPGNTTGDLLVHVYDADGVELRAFPTPAGTEGARGLAFDGENLWLCTYGGDSIYVLDAVDGSILRLLDFPGHLYKPVIVNDYLWLPFLEQIEDEDVLVLKKIVP